MIPNQSLTKMATLDDLTDELVERRFLRWRVRAEGGG